jgi:two-component system, OmpR family, sensor histidine kinase VicK
LTIRPLPPSSSPEKRSEILYGVDNAVGRGVYFMSNVKKRMDIYFDHRAPSIVVEVPEYRNGYIDIRKRGGKIRAFTEITKDNVKHCKDLIKLVDELRHLSGVKGGLAVSETEYMATTVLEEAKPLTQVIFSSVKEVVEQGQYIFDTLWNTAIPAEQRIREIEEGAVPIRTRLLENQDEIIKEIKRKNNAANKLSICTGFGGMQMSYNYLFDSYKNVVNKSSKKKVKGEKGEDFGLRWITNIDRDSLDLVKKFLEAGIKIRHIKNMPPLSFGVSDKEVAITIEKMEAGKMSRSLLISNEPLYVNHFNSLFDELWNNGIDAAERIKDIEQGVDLADIEVIPSSAKAQDKYLNTLKSALEEILLIFPTINAFLIQDKVSAIPLAIQAARERNVKVRILVPANNVVEQKVQALKEYCCHADTIDVRYIEQMQNAKATILVVDRKASLVMELKDDSKSTFYETIGLSTYSNSKAGILSYVAIFENLWKQSELYDQLKEAHEQVKIHDKMQREFIDVAAHELRTPIQPILGLSQVLQSKLEKDKNTEYQELLDPIVRNAKRLQQLTEDILDVTKIESQSLQLKKELLNINYVILSVLADYGTKIKKLDNNNNNNNNNVKITFNSKGDLFVMADRSRLYQVFANLFNNAIKFTKEGSITITVQRNHDVNEEAIVSIKDTGIGIDQEILPRLFSRFATKAETAGTGLGLFISKGIIQAHSGRIWAENNSDGKGATFSFSLPVMNKQ